MKNLDIRRKIIAAGYKAIDQLIKVAEEDIIKEDDTPAFDDEDGIVAKAQSESLSADRLKNAAATKKLSISDAFDILRRVEEEENDIEISANEGNGKDLGENGFAEGRSR